MTSFLLLALLAAALFAPLILLSRYEDRMAWTTRYLLSALPVAYTWAGWKLGGVAYDFFGCQGGMKNIHACFTGGTDFTTLVEHGFFLMILCIFVATPLSLWLLLNTGAKQVGAWHRKNFPTDGSKQD